ncbi:GntR family transcriptional regulator [Rhizocola hellebori]|uniref:GntR family transcriptional regulator n=1 Tax=Rhizocola hellebori TaxID=1392758 RepID=A0A8J3Q8E5_9ACTN|nr:GntR family transcriptional regulator [Rhizocola hellebori]
MSGRLVPGLRLPASRVLAERVGVSRNAVMSAYDMLISEGYAVTRPGGGTYVAAVIASPKQRPPAHAADSDPRLPARWRGDPELIVMAPTTDFVDDFVMGVPETSSFPYSLWARLAGRTLRQLSREPVRYIDPQGRAALREGIAKHVSFARAVSCLPDDVIVTSGAQQAFDLLARVLIVPGKTTVALEDPGYPPLRAALLAAGAKLVGVPVDEEGIIVERLPRRAQVIFVTPSHQFPMGAAMSMARRIALLTFANENNAVVIEDDYDGEFRHSGRPLDALQTLDKEQCVFYVGTFSKSLFPGLRLGFIVCPQWARRALLGAKQRADWHTAVHSQDTLAAFIGEGHLAHHIRKMRTTYHNRRAVLLEAIARYCGAWLWPILPDAGLHLAATMPESRQASALRRAAAVKGIRLDSLDRYAVSNSVVNGVGFGFGAIQTDRIEPAIQRLEKVAAGLWR